MKDKPANLARTNDGIVHYPYTSFAKYEYTTGRVKNVLLTCSRREHCGLDPAFTVTCLACLDLGPTAEEDTWDAWNRRLLNQSTKD